MNNKKGPGKPVNIYFSPEECRILGMGLGLIISDLNEISNDPTKPFNPQARKDMADINRHAQSAAAKIEKFTGISCQLDQYVPGDENQFYTKPS